MLPQASANGFCKNSSSVQGPLLEKPSIPLYSARRVLSGGVQVVSVEFFFRVPDFSVFGYKSTFFDKITTCKPQIADFEVQNQNPRLSSS